MFAIIFIQAIGPHVPIVYGQPNQQIDRSMSHIIEFLALRLARTHRLFGGGPFQNLKIGFFIHGQNDFAALPPALNSLVIPENFKGPLHGFVVPDRCFPVAEAMRTQIRFTQNISNRGMRNGVHLVLFHRRLCQASMRPVPQAPSDAGRFVLGQSLNLLALALGKKLSGDLTAERRTRRPANRADDNGRRPAKWWMGPGQSAFSGHQPIVGRLRVSIRPGPVAPTGEEFDRSAIIYAE